MPRGIPAEFSEYERRAIGLAVEMGWSIRDIARFLNRDKSVIHRHLKKQKPYPENPEDVEILLPVNVLTPGGPCPHGVIEQGDRVYCPKCHRTGIDDHPKLQKPRKRPKSKKDPAKFRPKGAKQQPAA